MWDIVVKTQTFQLAIDFDVDAVVCSMFTYWQLNVNLCHLVRIDKLKGLKYRIIKRFQIDVLCHSNWSI